MSGPLGEGQYVVPNASMPSRKTEVPPTPPTPARMKLIEEVSHLRLMSLGEIVQQCRQDSINWFPDTADDLAFQVLALVGETGEVANLVKKIERGSHTFEDVADHLGEEVVDVFIYLMNIVGLLQARTNYSFDLIFEYLKKRDLNEERFGGKA